MAGVLQTHCLTAEIYDGCRIAISGRGQNAGRVRRVYQPGVRGKERYNPDDVITFLHNDHLIGEYLQNNEFRRYRSYEQYSAGMEKYGKYFVTPSLKARIEALGAPLYDTKAGSPAADFTYPDVEGNRVSLSDFKGKVVLVDVWATWCSPCRKEIPPSEKPEEGDARHRCGLFRRFCR